MGTRMFSGLSSYMSLGLGNRVVKPVLARINEGVIIVRESEYDRLRWLQA
jgi:hypothetical protein